MLEGRASRHHPVSEAVSCQPGVSVLEANEPLLPGELCVTIVDDKSTAAHSCRGWIFFGHGPSRPLSPRSTAFARALVRTVFIAASSADPLGGGLAPEDGSFLRVRPRNGQPTTWIHLRRTSRLRREQGMEHSLAVVVAEPVLRHSFGCDRKDVRRQMRQVCHHRSAIRDLLRELLSALLATQVWLFLQPVTQDVSFRQLGFTRPSRRISRLVRCSPDLPVCRCGRSCGRLRSYPLFRTA